MEPEIQKELNDLRDYVDESFGEVLELFMEIKTWKEELMTRINNYNSRAAHKL